MGAETRTSCRGSLIERPEFTCISRMAHFGRKRSGLPLAGTGLPQSIRSNPKWATLHSTVSGTRPSNAVARFQPGVPRIRFVRLSGAECTRLGQGAERLAGNDSRNAIA